MTKAKQLLLESSIIAKDMEILVLKEKLESKNKIVESIFGDMIFELENKTEEKVCFYNEYIMSQQQLAKIPNWIKWFFL